MNNKSKIYFALLLNIFFWLGYLVSAENLFFVHTLIFFSISSFIVLVKNRYLFTISLICIFITAVLFIPVSSMPPVYICVKNDNYKTITVNVLDMKTGESHFHNIHKNNTIKICILKRRDSTKQLAMRNYIFTVYLENKLLTNEMLNGEDLASKVHSY